MKFKLFAILLLLALLVAVNPVTVNGAEINISSVLIKGSDRTVEIQSLGSGTYPYDWEWVVGENHYHNANQQGFTANGRLAVYEQTHDNNYLSAAKNAGDNLVARCDSQVNDFALRPWVQDVEFLVQLSQETGDSSYLAKATNYFNRSAANITAADLVNIRIAARPVNAETLPDLVITSISATPALNHPTWYDVTFTVRNQGTADAAATDTSFLVDGSEYLNPDCPALAAGSSVTITVPWDTIADISGGIDTIEVILDLSNNITESNETNNAAATTYSIYTIAASAGVNGSISPSGDLIVGQGGHQSFNITANAGYYISDVLVDGCSKGPVASYTFSDVQTGHSISAILAVNAPETPFWDLNNDHVCNIGDVVELGLHWEETGMPGWIPQDLNHDGIINIGDVVVIGQHWGETW